MGLEIKERREFLRHNVHQAAIEEKQGFIASLFRNDRLFAGGKDDGQASTKAISLYHPE